MLNLLSSPSPQIILYLHIIYNDFQNISVNSFFANSSCHSAYAFLVSNSSSCFLGRVIGYSITPRWAAVPSCAEWAGTFQNNFMQIG